LKQQLKTIIYATESTKIIIKEQIYTLSDAVAYSVCRVLSKRLKKGKISRYYFLKIFIFIQTQIMIRNSGTQQNI